jgi:hypothetical protein
MKRLLALSALLVPATLLPSPVHAEKAKRPRKVVLIAGPLDKSHPPGTHEYEKSVRLLKHCLDHSPNVKGVRAEAHLGGWPRDPRTLDDADTIVLVSSGSDRRERDHPLLVGDRLAVLGRQMKRGCGLVLIHWATFVPKKKAGEKVLDWVGGYFDYESGPAPRGWYSKISVARTKVRPASPRHPICSGLAPFELNEEYYYHLRFRERDPRLVPILTTPIPGEKGDQVVAWAVQRKDGGRGFGFTGGHFFANFRVEDFRRMLLNAVLWTAHADVPPGGVRSKAPTEEELASVRVATPRRPADPAWTPPPAPGPAPDWRRQTDEHWVDPRLRRMDTGPFFNATAEYPSWSGKVRSFKSTALRVGDDGRAAVLFDRNQLRLAAGWTGAFLHHSDRRFGLLNTPTPAGTIAFTTPSGPGWTNPRNTWDDPHPPTAPLPRDWAKYKGLYLHGKHAVLSYTVGAADVLDSPWVEKSGPLTAFTRTIQIGPTPRPLRLLVCELPAEGKVRTVGGVSLAGAKKDGFWTVASLVGKGASLAPAGKRLEVSLQADPSPRRFKLLLANAPEKDLPALARLVKHSPPPADLKAWTRPGPARWGKPLVTKGEVGRGEGPFAIDTLTVPYDNPHHALMFLSGVDFLPTGEVVVCTAHGDVWLVGAADRTLDRLTWKRFATGLYQPLGLKVVGGKVVVLERGQLTRLHDTNGDGEADFYENLNNDWHTGGGEHSFDTCLETDPAGNFYFFKTGDPETPTGGCLLRVSKDGKKCEVFATGFRHPIGLSVSPKGLVTGADQQGNWMPATRIDVYRKGGFYGDMRTHHRLAPPKTYDPPLCWLPHDVDNSAGGQVWVPHDKFGLPKGSLLHLSYGQCRMFLLPRQQVGGVHQGGGIDLGLFFLSGVMRGRFHPRDGHLYLAGLRGWQNAARRDGCLQRVRYTGNPVYLPVGLAVEPGGLRLTFSRKVDPKRASERARYSLEQWNYRWTAEYGSDDWSVARPDRKGHDPVPVESATVSEGGREVFLRVRGLRPVMQMKVAYDLKAADGQPLKGDLYLTINKVPKPAP